MGNAESRVTGVRAPALKRPMPKSWSKPEWLFNGKGLTGWEPLRKMGAIFGHYAGAKEIPLNLGTWQTYDITLVGRYVRL